MAIIISLKDLQAFDYETAIDEVELLVPKYLQALKHLEEINSFEEISSHLQNVKSYWSRLFFLLKQIQAVAQEPALQEAITHSLQSELSVLERIYLMVNERIHFSQEHWTVAMWKAADLVLNRMDVVLECMGFETNHKDRELIREIIRGNYTKEHSQKQNLIKYNCSN